MTDLERMYEAALSEPTDIVEHLPLLRSYASHCEHVTEFGVRRGMSTRALAMGRPKHLVCYDINPLQEGLEVLQAAKNDGVNARMIYLDTRDCNYEPTDLLFIDTLHTHAQVAAELRDADRKVRRWILLHDTVSCGVHGEQNEPGILGAINSFLKRSPRWFCEAHHENCNGMMVLANPNSLPVKLST